MRLKFAFSFLVLATAAILISCNSTDNTANTNSRKPAGTEVTYADGARRVTIEELDAMIKNGEAYIVDVRNQASYDIGHIPGSKLIPAGEIANRIIWTCKEMGITPVAIYSDADRTALHVAHAHEAYRVGGPESRESYLNIPRLVAACEITGADAIHPGYGFLAENARFAEILEGHDITFIGPSSEHIRIMGDKIEAKTTVKRLGIPVVPGSEGPVANAAQAARIAADMGYPVLIKATAGGGGRGMKVVRSPEELDIALKTARSAP